MPSKQNSANQPTLKRDEEKLHDSKIESSVHITDHAEAGPPSNDMFYKKDSDRHLLSGNEDDIDEIAEIKPQKKVIKVSESDFETDAVPTNERTKGKQSDRPGERDRDLRNSKKGQPGVLSSTD